MKKRRMLALVLVCCMAFGQTVWAQDVQESNEEAALVQEETQAKGEEPVGGQEVVQEDEQEESSEVVQEEEPVEGQEAAQEDEQREASEADMNAIDNYEEKVVYIGQPIVVGNNKNSYGKDFSFTFESGDETVCRGAVRLKDAYGDYYKYCYLEIEGVAEGKTDVIVKANDSIIYAYHITVKALPDDAVVFKDNALFNALIKPFAGVESNGDGYISQEELAAVTYLNMSYNGEIKDLSGLEYATNLEKIYLDNAINLENVDALFALENLTYIDLRNTKVPAETRIELAKFNFDSVMAKGESREILSNGNIFDDSLNVMIVDGEGIIEVQDNGCILAKDKGIATIRILYQDYSKDLVVTVDGIMADQEVGDESKANISSTQQSAVLSNNGHLWELYPEVKNIKKNVEKYVGGWAYSGSDYFEFAYALDSHGKLWSDEQMIAENVKDFSGHYALDNNDILTDIYNTDAISIENVKEWMPYRRRYMDDEKQEAICEDRIYVLKKDGTLWSRIEVEKEKTVNEFQKVADGVQEIGTSGYLLSNNGGYVSYGGYTYSDYASIPTYVYGNYVYYYLGMDGHSYLHTYWDGTYDLGNVELADCSSWVYEYDESGERQEAYYYLTKAGDLYRLVFGVENRKIDEDVVELNYIGSGYPFSYKTADGKYRNANGETGTVENPLMIEEYFDWILEDYGIEGDYNLTRNDLLILTHVKQIWVSTYGKEYRAFVTRTDGTIWDVTGVPEMILDLNEDSYIKGDVNEDTEVDISDLRMILQNVCGKIKLTERQEQSADVTEDGTVDLQDLRRVLQFVSGKTTEL